ncbi:hypothetical protein B6V73_03925 [Thioclava sp. JM3]|uniref:helix-turn-helix domain-containing protein n=1 Tax=Thioclava sp. JM3 TaxID=1973004 RepID=UPI000B53A76A|nr:LysR family transcriptional regulator [Thioclava sp. JM3]OWY17771.1 hypothetical protein B6V73_03925 [Thioclava sp. JM3]
MTVTRRRDGQTTAAWHRRLAKAQETLKDINLKAMKHFVAVARLGGILKVAEELGASPSPVSERDHSNGRAGTEINRPG